MKALALIIYRDISAPSSNKDRYLDGVQTPVAMDDDSAKTDEDDDAMIRATGRFWGVGGMHNSNKSVLKLIFNKVAAR